jgi:hypothetical protein
MRRPIWAVEITGVDWASASACAGVLLTVAALGARPAAAQQNSWAAVAVSPSTLESSQSHGTTTQTDVERGALQACQARGDKDCKLIHTVMNSCAALAVPATLIPNYYGYGNGATREAAAAQALADCAKGGAFGCNVREAPCSSDDPRWGSPLPLPPGGTPGSVDPALVGLWKLYINSGIWVMQISANGTYTVHTEAADNAPSNDGTFTTSNGHYTMHAINMQSDDQGTYTVPSSGVMVASGKLGTGTWYRIATDPSP